MQVVASLSKAYRAEERQLLSSLLFLLDEITKSRTSKRLDFMSTCRCLVCILAVEIVKFTTTGATGMEMEIVVWETSGGLKHLRPKVAQPIVCRLGNLVVD
jgi:hypothetical protein